MKRTGLWMLLLWSFCASVFCEAKSYSWDFSDCDIRDIVFAVSMDTGISIVTDDTVAGKGIFRFTGKDFETAFESFLTGSRLYVSKKNKVWTVSRFRLSETDGLYSLDAYDLSPSLLMEKLCNELDSVITYEVLPAGTVTVHFKNLSQKELMEKIALRFQGFEVQEKANGYHFGKKSNGYKDMDFSSGFINLEVLENGYFKLDAKDIKVSEVLERLFKLKKDSQFCLLANTGIKIARCCFTAESFESCLEKFCSLNGFGVVQKDSMFFITSNAGSRETLVKDKSSWKLYTTKYIKTEKLLQLVNKKIGNVEYVLLPDEFSFLCSVSEKEAAEIEELINLVDLKTEMYVIKLNYLKPSDFLNQLPPSVDKNSVSVAEDKFCVYFKGTDEAYKNLCTQIEILDRPVPRISYDLLILQCDEGTENSWSSAFDMKKLSLGDRNTILFKTGKALSLNLNVITAFGLDFALGLQSSIEDNKAKVYADTKLFGISGKKINFQNTNTYRYRDNNLDPDTGKPVYSGVTKEIISGLKLEVLGVVSSDNSITSSVTASFTRQGTDTSSSTGNPPPTTEKLVTTEVRGKSGEPIVLSGLLQNSSMDSAAGVPWISKIPVIGNLFKSKEEIYEKSQMIIYLIPHLEGEQVSNSTKTKWNSDWAEKRIMELKEIFNEEDCNEKL